MMDDEDACSSLQAGIADVNAALDMCDILPKVRRESRYMYVLLASAIWVRLLLLRLLNLKLTNRVHNYK